MVIRRGGGGTGRDEQDAAVQAAEALALRVEGMVEAGEALPDPSGLHDPLPGWAADEDDGGEEIGRVLVPVEPPGRAIRVNVTVTEGPLDRLDRAAAAEGDTRSGFIAQAVRERVGTGRWIIASRRVRVRPAPGWGDAAGGSGLCSAPCASPSPARASGAEPGACSP